MKSQTFHDFSQLPKALAKSAPKVEEVKPQPMKKATENDSVVLTYFGVGPTSSAPKTAQTGLPTGEGPFLDALNKARSEAERAKKELSETRTELAAAQREIARLKTLCARLGVDVHEKGAR